MDLDCGFGAASETRTCRSSWATSSDTDSSYSECPGNRQKMPWPMCPIAQLVRKQAVVTILLFSNGFLENGCVILRVSAVRKLMLWIYHSRTRLSPDLRHQLWIAAPSGQASEPSGTSPTLLELEESSTCSDVSQCRGGSWLWVGQAPQCLERAVGTQTHPTCLSKSRSCGKVGLDSRPFYPTVVKPAQLQIDPHSV